jgi:hypothetical protein
MTYRVALDSLPQDVGYALADALECRWHELWKLRGYKRNDDDRERVEAALRFFGMVVPTRGD